MIDVPSHKLLALDRTLLQFALQSAPVHAEASCRGGDVAAVIVQYLLDVFPLETVDRRPLFADSHVDVAVLLREGQEKNNNNKKQTKKKHGTEQKHHHNGDNTHITRQHNDASVGGELRQ